MKIFYYNYSFTEQSIRQLETMTSFIEGEEFYFDSCWRKRELKNPKYKYMQFEEFLKIDGKKIIIFFNVMDGKKLYKYRQNKEISFVFRPRGITPEESYYKNKNIIKKKVLNYIEKKSIKLSDYFIFLNEAQKIHFLSKYQEYTSKIEKNSILPNITKIKLNNFGEKSCDKLKIVYSGGFSKWQNIESVFKLFSNINKEINAEFIVLTFNKNHKTAKEFAIRYGINNKFTCKYIEPNNLGDELSNYDIGVVIRDDNIVNQTASPFKIVDYISNGLGLILTDNISSFPKLILNKNLIFELKFTKGKVIYDENFIIDYLKKYLCNKECNKEKTKYLYNNYLKNFRKLNLN